MNKFLKVILSNVILITIIVVIILGIRCASDNKKTVEEKKIIAEEKNQGRLFDTLELPIRKTTYKNYRIEWVYAPQFGGENGYIIIVKIVVDNSRYELQSNGDSFAPIKVFDIFVSTCTDAEDYIDAFSSSAIKNIKLFEWGGSTNDDDAVYLYNESSLFYLSQAIVITGYTYDLDDVTGKSIEVKETIKRIAQYTHGQPLKEKICH